MVLAEATHIRGDSQTFPTSQWGQTNLHKLVKLVASGVERSGHGQVGSQRHVLSRGPFHGRYLVSAEGKTYR